MRLRGLLPGREVEDAASAVVLELLAQEWSGVPVRSVVGLARRKCVGQRTLWARRASREEGDAELQRHAAASPEDDWADGEGEDRAWERILALRSELQRSVAGAVKAGGTVTAWAEKHGMRRKQALELVQRTIRNLGKMP